jgi:hypothetical protein
MTIVIRRSGDFMAAFLFYAALVAASLVVFPLDCKREARRAINLPIPCKQAWRRAFATLADEM